MKGTNLKASSSSKGPSLMLRLAVTFMVPVAVALTDLIPLPMAGKILAPNDYMGESFMGIFAMGLTPVIPAFIFVEVLALIVPRWRRYRISGPVGRQRLFKITLIAVFVISLFQGWGIITYLDSLSTVMTVQVFFTGFDKILSLAILVAGSFALIFAARFVDRHGLCNGFSALLCFDVALHAFDFFSKFETAPLAAAEEKIQAVVAFLAIGAAVAAAVKLFARRERLEFEQAEGDGEVFALRFPSGGMLSLMHVFSVMSFPVAAMALAGFHSPLVESLLDVDSLFYAAVACPLIVCGSIMLSFIFNIPKRVNWVLGLTGAPREEIDRMLPALKQLVFRSGAKHGLILCGFFIFGSLLADFSPYTNGLYGSVLVFVAAAVGLDVVAEWRYRKRNGDVVPVWPLHRVYAVDPTLAALKREGIDAFARSVHHRTLLHFFGPFIPIQIYVPPEKKKQAQELLTHMFIYENPPEDSREGDVSENC